MKSRQHILTLAVLSLYILNDRSIVHLAAAATSNTQPLSSPFSVPPPNCFDELPPGVADAADATAPFQRRCFTLAGGERTSTWHDSQVGCAKSGERLAIVDRADVEAWLGGQLMTLVENQDDDDSYGVWIGGHERNDSYMWTWTDGQPFDVEAAATVHVTTEFSIVQKEYQNCGAVKVNGTTTFTLASSMCRTALTHFLCQQTDVDNSTDAEADSSTVSCRLSDDTPGLRLRQSCFAVVTSPVPLSWFKASAHCQSLGARLAVLLDPSVKHLQTADNSTASADLAATGTSSSSTDVDYISALTEYIRSVTGNKTEPEQLLVWTGLVRNPWAWVVDYRAETRTINGTLPLVYTDWQEPSQPNKESQDCLLVEATEGGFGWSDELCNLSAAYVCEKLTTIAPPTTTTVPPTTDPAVHENVFNSSNFNATDAGGGHDGGFFNNKDFVTGVVISVLLAFGALVIFLGICCYFSDRRKGYERQP